jgi:predicted porin
MRINREEIFGPVASVIRVADAEEALAVARLDTRNSDSDATMLVARLTYPLSKRTAVYGSVGRIDNKGSSAASLDAGGTAGPGQAQNGVMLGLRHSF